MSATFDLAKLTFGEILTQAYTGNPIEPAVSILNGTTPLTLGTDYTVEYANNTNAGEGTVTVTGTGDYSGTKTLAFVISDVLLGDADDNGKINIMDLVEIIDFIVNKNPVASAINADADENGKINIMDLVEIIDFMVNKNPIGG